MDHEPRDIDDPIFREPRDRLLGQGTGAASRGPLKTSLCTTQSGIFKASRSRSTAFLSVSVDRPLGELARPPLR
jgi:hypothetical protein